MKLKLKLKSDKYTEKKMGMKVWERRLKTSSEMKRRWQELAGDETGSLARRKKNADEAGETRR